MLNFYSRFRATTAKLFIAKSKEIYQSTEPANPGQLLNLTERQQNRQRRLRIRNSTHLSSAIYDIPLRDWSSSNNESSANIGFVIKEGRPCGT